MNVSKIFAAGAVSRVAYSKGSGLIRDLLIVYLFGLSSLSDALFLCMTCVMLFQLTAYQGNMNLLGKGSGIYKAYCWCTKNSKLIILLYLICACLAFFVFELLTGRGASILVSFLVSIALSFPFCFVIGLIASYKVLDGDNLSHVTIVSIQNTVTIIGVCIVSVFFDLEYAFLVWYFSGLVVFTYILLSRSINVISQLKSDDIYSVDLKSSFLSPVVTLSIGLVERFFYSSHEGGVGLIKLLEAGAMTIIFIMEVFFLNRVLSELAREEEINELNVRQRLLGVFFKSLPLGSGLMLIFLIVFNILGMYNLLPFEMTDSMKPLVLWVSVFYFAYFLAVLLRDYSEKYFFINGMAANVFIVNIFVILCTLAINFIFIDFAPLSILCVSIFLLVSKTLFLFLCFKPKIVAV